MRKIALAVVVLLTIVGAALFVVHNRDPNRFDSARWKAAGNLSGSSPVDLSVRNAMCGDLSSGLIGKTKDEVVDLLGKPDREGMGEMFPGPGPDGIEIWSYYLAGGGNHWFPYFEVTLKNGRVVSCKVASRPV